MKVNISQNLLAVYKLFNFLIKWIGGKCQIDLLWSILFPRKSITWRYFKWLTSQELQRLTLLTQTPFRSSERERNCLNRLKSLGKSISLHFYGPIATTFGQELINSIKQSQYKSNFEPKQTLFTEIKQKYEEKFQAMQITNINDEEIKTCLDSNSFQGRETQDTIVKSKSEQAEQLLSKTNSSSESKLAVRSDVVNKTLLRSLKRYYTSEFEKVVKWNLHGKLINKDEIFDKLKKFTKEIYQNDARFNLPEFSGVTIDDLIFYMGVCINPVFMKKCSSSSHDRNKYQNFYNCLYKYSHK